MSSATPAIINEILKAHSGEANAEAKHVVVPLHMPLGSPLTLAQALRCVCPELRDEVRRGEATLIAVAHGTMMLDGRPKKLQLVLFRDDEGYQTFETFEDEYDMAVLLDGGGRRYLSPDPLPREVAVARWMAGFVNWNCEVPGLYRLRFALIESPDRDRSDN